MRKVEITHPDKILFPKGKITKQEMADYYARIASKMLPLIKDRPISMKRFPGGIKEEGFFQKNIPEGAPSWIKTYHVKKKEGGSIDMILCNDKATLLWMANQNCITPHIWLSKWDKPDQPDMMVFDLDPPKGKKFEDVIEAALTLKKILETSYRLKSTVMLTGSKGVHVIVRLKRKAHFDEVREKAKAIAEHLVASDPKKYTLEVRKEKRKGRLYIDIMRNSKGATVVAPYALRSLEGAPIATPLTWAQLKRPNLRSDSFTIRKPLV